MQGEAGRVTFTFHPLVNVRIGAIVGVEALPRLMSESDPLHVVTTGGRAELDWLLVTAAIHDFARHETPLPLHVNLPAGSLVADPGRLDALRETVRLAGRHEQEIVLEIGPPASGLGEGLLAAAESVRGCGFRLVLDHVGGSEVPLELVADLRPDMVKLDRRLLREAAQHQHRMAVLEAVARVSASTGSLLLADGVDEEKHLMLLHRLGVPLVQGDLLAPAEQQPPASIAVYARTVGGEPLSLPAAEPDITGPRVSEFMEPAVMLPASVTADRVRAAFAAHPEITGVVLVDAESKPQQTIDRTRFLLAVTGPYGHALHAKKSAARLADKPRLVTTSTTAVETLELVARSDPNRSQDDTVVIDEVGRCLGVVPASTLIRGMAEVKVQEAAALNPLTRLPGSDAVASEFSRRIERGEACTLSWLDVNAFDTLTETVGIAATDDVIREVGSRLIDAAKTLPSLRIAHSGGDDFLLLATTKELFALAGKLLDVSRSVDGVPVTLSLATLECGPASTASFGAASRRLASLKRFARSLQSNGWVLSRPGTDRIEVLRGQRPEEAPDSGDAEVLSPDDPGPVRGQGVGGQPYADAMASAAVAIGVFNSSERLVHANKALGELLGYEPDQLLGLSTEGLAHPQDSPGNGYPWAAAPESDQRPAVSQRLLARSDGQPVHCELRATMSVQDGGSPLWVVVFFDITQRHHVTEALRHQATHDSLTGLPNRMAAVQLLDRQLAEAGGGHVGVLLCDIDNFKRINDSLGHDAGDDLLVALARRLQGGLPAGCTPAKLPGDEFLVICPDVDAAGGLDAVAVTVSSLLRTSLPLHGQLVRVSASTGAAVPYRPADRAEDLLRFADAAMHQAKRRGAGRVSLAGPTLMTSADRQLELEGELREALQEGGLTLQYQPLVGADGTIVAAEALVRWPHRTRGMLRPGAFLPVAEHGDLMGDLDRWVLVTAMREAASWPEVRGHPVELAVNLGGLMPDTVDFADEIADMIAASGIDRSRVVLELVETSLFELSPRAMDTMHRLGEWGVRFAIDDFGTGYSSLGRLKNLPTQIIKTDSALISGVASDPSDLAIIRAVVEMGHALGRRCVAEGVETTTQFQRLRPLGLDAYQGHLFAHPLPPQDLRTALVNGPLFPSEEQ